MRWIALYVKYHNPEYDPFDCSVHGWQVEAETCQQALEILEQRLDVPFRIFWIETIAFDELANYQRDQLEGEKVLLHS